MEDIINSLIKIADADLKSAKLLYENKSYYNSLFLFQQAMEKSYKATGLLIGQLDLIGLRLVGHDYIKLLKKTVKDGFAGTQHYLDSTFYKMIAEDIDITTNEIEATMSSVKRDIFFDLTDEALVFFVKLIDNQQDYITHTFETIVESPDFFRKLQDAGQLTQDDIDSLKTSNFQSVEEKTAMLTFSKHLITFNILGLITSPHSEQTRYPFLNNGSVSCPTEIYTMDMPIIKHQMKLMLIAEASINYFRNHDM